MAEVLIVGANRGIGLELARQLGARGAHVIGACRTASAELRAVAGVEVIEGIEVTSDASMNVLRRELGERKLDTVLVVAGVLRHVGLDNLDFDVIREQLEVNALGPLRVVAAVRGNIMAGGKVGLVTSRMGSIADNDSGGRYGYRMSKAALNMAGKSLAVDLRAAEIAVALLHPGFVRTEMTGGTGLIDAPEAAAGLIERMDALTLASSGGFWHENGDKLPW